MMNDIPLIKVTQSGNNNKTLDTEHKKANFVPLMMIFGVCIPLLLARDNQLQIWGTLLQYSFACTALYIGYKQRRFSKFVFVLGTAFLVASALVIIGYT